MILIHTRQKGHESALMNSLVVLVDISTNIIPLYKLVLLGSMEKFSLPTGGRLSRRIQQHASYVSVAPEKRKRDTNPHGKLSIF